MGLLGKVARSYQKPENLALLFDVIDVFFRHCYIDVIYYSPY